MNSRITFHISSRILLASAVTAVLSAGTAIAATPASAATTMEGITRQLTADPADAGQGSAAGASPAAHDRQVLEVGGTSYFLTGATLPVNTRVRISGSLVGRSMRVSSSQALTASAQTTAGLSTVSATGTTQVLVMLVDWTAPDSVTPASARQQMFADSNSWYRHASHGMLGQSGDVTRWLHIAGPAGNKCFADYANVMSQAKNAATSAGYVMNNYTNFVVYFPNDNTAGSDCGGYAGWSYVGAANIWLNGAMNRRAIVHEEGHNYGLGHGHSDLCSKVIQGSCTFSDYGNDFDAMGAANYVGDFAASQKADLGWMAGRIVDLTHGGRVGLHPLELRASSTQAVRIRVSRTRSYWIEYRQPVGNDAGLPSSGTDGVLVNVRDSQISGDTGPSLLDLRPADGLSAETATLRPGTGWTTPEGYRISLGSVSATGAAISVRAPAAR